MFDTEVCINRIKELLIIDKTLGLKLNRLELFDRAIWVYEMKDVDVFHVALIVSAEEAQVLVISVDVKPLLKIIVVDVICVLQGHDITLEFADKIINLVKLCNVFDGSQLVTFILRDSSFFLEFYQEIWPHLEINSDHKDC